MIRSVIQRHLTVLLIMAIRIIFSDFKIFGQASKSAQPSKRSPIQRLGITLNSGDICVALTRRIQRLPLYPWSPEKAFIESSWSQTSHPWLVSVILAAWTWTVSILPNVSVAMWRLRPLTFFPPIGAAILTGILGLNRLRIKQGIGRILVFALLMPCGSLSASKTPR